jgi:hypothetical protein
MADQYFAGEPKAVDGVTSSANTRIEPEPQGSEGLKACSSCGSTHVDYVYTTSSERRTSGYYRRCEKCQARGPISQTLEGSARKWNTRVADARIAELERELEQYIHYNERVNLRLIAANEKIAELERKA